MKIKSIIATAALLGVMSATASAVTTVAQPNIFEAPIPLKTVEPILLPPNHQGSEVSLSMSIDTAGKPSNVRVLSASDQAAYKRIIATVAQWQFSPARKNGVAVPSRIVLPLEVKGL